MDLPVKWQNRSVMLPWPSLPFSSWLKCIFAKTNGEAVLGGFHVNSTFAWEQMHVQFWSRYKEAFGNSHPVFSDHEHQLRHCLPVMLHGDEGRGKLRRAVMCTSVQPVIRPLDRAHSFCSRYLFALLPGEIYEADLSLSVLHDALVQDLIGLYQHGIVVPCLSCEDCSIGCKQSLGFILICQNQGEW